MLKNNKEKTIDPCDQVPESIVQAITKKVMATQQEEMKKQQEAQAASMIQTFAEMLSEVIGHPVSPSFVERSPLHKDVGSGFLVGGVGCCSNSICTRGLLSVNGDQMLCFGRLCDGCHGCAYKEQALEIKVCIPGIFAACGYSACIFLIAVEPSNRSEEVPAALRDQARLSAYQLWVRGHSCFDLDTVIIWHIMINLRKEI
ncbi:uncharacterized protein A4U43_C04F35330 [Asparagus officinalis]|uniref:Uncharacterized protein n=1 Tax=Asparagus officinalis TaxID=4686 RepID=A0A5P1F6P5_ASPOF|nr:uncharacterized protein A4U43_C04F35330 [Asparagus officinalis]